MAGSLPPFDDSRQRDVRRSDRIVSDNDTESVEAYRQGVEMTVPRHYVAGIVKIHCGDRGQDGDHHADTLVLGEQRPELRTTDVSYVEQARLVPTDRLSMILSGSAFARSAAGRALIAEDANGDDGTVEPFVIRDVVFGRVTRSELTRLSWGTLAEGNCSDRMSSDRFVTVVKFVDRRRGKFDFEDEADTAGSMLLSGLERSRDGRVVGPFSDTDEPNGVQVNLDTMENDVLNALRAMDPPSENRLPPGYYQPGASGFVF